MNVFENEQPLRHMIDLLVDGELDDSSRRDLLNRLDNEADGWKCCALAFLEDQAWKAAIVEPALARKSLVREPLEPVVRPRDRTSRSLAWVARAAVVLLAFSVGWAMRPAPARKIPSPIPATIEHVAKPSPPSQDPALAEAVPEMPPASSPSYLRGRLQREGYQMERRILMVPGSKNDGSPVAVPVEQVKVRFVGNRSV